MTLTAQDNFGTATALSADAETLAVGANGTDSDRGAVYIFEKSGGAWSQSLKISNSAGAGNQRIVLPDNHNFGISVALSADGTLLAVGATGDGVTASRYRGAVYLFEKSGDTWSQSLKISDNESGTGELDVPLSANNIFGSAVALSANGTLLAVGAAGDSSYKGSVYLFEKTGGNWSQLLKISDNSGGAGQLDIDLTRNVSFGAAAALSPDGTVLAVGANGDHNQRGAVYLFNKSGGSWSQSLKMSDNDGGDGELDVPLDFSDNFGSTVAFSGEGSLLAVGAAGDDDGNGDNSGAIYLFGDTGSARAVTVSAVADETGTVWQYVETTGSACGAAQFIGSPNAYTEGAVISFSAESDNEKNICFKTTDRDENTGYTLTDGIKTVDLTAPTLTATRIGTGNTREYRVRAADSSITTGRTKDDVADVSCTTATDTGGSTWDDYTPGEVVGTAHDTNGRCVIVTDGAGNISKIHLSDSDSVPQDFTLDLDASGTFEPNKDAILLYLYTNQGASASELASFTHDGEQGTVASAIAAINRVKDNANTPLDMDGNGTFTANTDGAIPYLHSGQGYDATSLTSFTHNGSQSTASDAITLVRGTITPNWP